MSRRGRPPKIASPWGTITTRVGRDGTMRYRLRGIVEGRSVSCGTYDTIAEAVRAAQAQAVALGVQTGPLTLGGWIAEWLDEREAAGTHRSVDSMRALVRAYLDGTPLAAMTLRHVSAQHVAQWIAQLAQRRATRGRGKGKPISEQTMKNALHLVSAAFRDAIPAKARANPCVGLRVPRRTRTEETWTYLTLEEIARVLARPELDAPRAVSRGIRAALTVAIYAGLREGELWGLHWHDVHLDAVDPYAIVRHSYGGPTKSGKPRRVPLLPPAIAALREWRTVQRREQARAAERRGRPIPLRGLVWPAVDGGHHAEGYDAGWSRLRDECGFERVVRLHDLRHTFATHLISGSWGRAWTIDEVQAVMGHAERSTTERYAHLAPEARIRAEREARAAWDSGPVLAPASSADREST